MWEKDDAERRQQRQEERRLEAEEAAAAADLRATAEEEILREADAAELGEVRAVAHHGAALRVGLHVERRERVPA